MKMKHCMAALLFGVVAVGAAAQADTKWERVGDIWHGTAHSAQTLDALCARVVDERERLNSNIYGGVRYLGYYVFPEDYPYIADCQITPSLYAGYTSISIAPECRSGGSWSKERPDGCYEMVDCNSTFPEGRIPKVCTTPEPDPKRCDPSNYPNGIVPEDCPKTEPKDPCAAVGLDTDSDGKKSYGGIACVDGKPSKVCVWDNNISADHTNPQAAGIISQCVKKHEEFHLAVHEGEVEGVKDYVMICKEFGDGYRGGYANEKNELKKECDPYMIELDCLKTALVDNQCGTDAECKNQIDNVIKNRVKKINNSNVCQGVTVQNEYLCGDGFYYNKKTGEVTKYTEKDFMSYFCK